MTPACSVCPTFVRKFLPFPLLSEHKVLAVCLNFVQEGSHKGPTLGSHGPFPHVLRQPWDAVMCHRREFRLPLGFGFETHSRRLTEERNTLSNAFMNGPGDGASWEKQVCGLFDLKNTEAVHEELAFPFTADPGGSASLFLSYLRLNTLLLQ